MSNRFLLVVAVAALLPCRAFAQTDAAPTAPENLVTDGVPPIPSRVVDAARRYGDVRAAAFWDWHPTRREMIIGTRFGDAQQLHQGRRGRGVLPEVPLRSRDRRHHAPDRWQVA